jgi:hypothetical protein
VKPEDLGDKVADAGFLNALQSGLNNWQKDIQKVTKLDRFVLPPIGVTSDGEGYLFVFYRIENMPPSGDTLQEINFWLELEVELQHINEQLASPEAGILYLISASLVFLLFSSLLHYNLTHLVCTFNILRGAKRYFATLSFDTDTIGLKKSTDKGKYSPPHCLITHDCECSGEFQEFDKRFPDP